MRENIIQDALLGVAVGDALGVPVEFVSRGLRDDNPVQGMRGDGTHNQKPGTWSDDTSLALCLAEMLCGPYSLRALAGYFINWRRHGFYTAHGYVFDIGNATALAIENLSNGIEPALAGGNDEYSNGNGSLMRILPLVFFIKDMPVEQRFAVTRDVSSLTHRHIRSIVSCFIYLEYARLLIAGHDKMSAYEKMRREVIEFLQTREECDPTELNRFHRVLQLEGQSKPLTTLRVDEIYSSGYVVDTLEASLWCILTTDNFSEAVLKAVNLGEDTDTTGAVTGGLAGIIYGSDSIPGEWLSVLAKRNEIEQVAGRMQMNLVSRVSSLDNHE